MKNRNHQVILGIIKDALIADRTFGLIREATNVLSPSQHNGGYRVDYSYSGVENAFLLMGVTDDDVKDELYTVFSGFCVDDGSVQELPEKIYVEWLSILANQYVSDALGVIDMKPN